MMMTYDATGLHLCGLFILKKGFGFLLRWLRVGPLSPPQVAGGRLPGSSRSCQSQEGTGYRAPAIPDWEAILESQVELRRLSSEFPSLGSSQVGWLLLTLVLLEFG